MISAKEKYVINEKGKRVGVILDMKEYQKVTDALEELESIRQYDLAKSSKSKKTPLANALKEIETKRKKARK